MSVKGSTVSSKLLICIENWNFKMSAATISQTHEHVHNVPIQRWSCFVDNVSSRTNAMQCLQL